MPTLETRYALIVVGQEVRSHSAGMLVTPAGARFWVRADRDGWVEATATRVVDGQPMPRDLRTFATPEEAQAFAARWPGHPWWYVPAGACEIVPVRPVVTEVVTGWEPVA